MSELLRFEIDKNYFVVDLKTKAFYADLSIKINNDKIEDRITYREINFENDIVKVIKLVICKTSLNAYICGASGYIKMDIKDFNDAVKVYRVIEDVAKVI
ncbi:MAG: hypothetical protein OWQ54_09490 [Sulfolobaceae archaeon]|nr:hypothetical protein [Sulfolobaceae archaeon]